MLCVAAINRKRSAFASLNVSSCGITECSPSSGRRTAANIPRRFHVFPPTENSDSTT